MEPTLSVCTPRGVAPTLDIVEDEWEEEEPDVTGDWPPGHQTICDKEMERSESDMDPTSNILLAQQALCEE